ncbi:GTP cyclohydrolase I [Thomasclavelia spiroformis]|uniref:GTP cyclohydrolase I n=1 Tax=Thomasclavelia spiroformis TaxID=29348 RepID=UPI0039953767
MEEHIYEIIKALNDNPNCKDLKETSKRVAKIYKEVFMSMNIQMNKSLKSYFCTILFFK